MDITNMAQVNAFLRDQVAGVVIENVSDKIMKLLRENILKYVYLNSYSSYYLGGSRTPSYEFLNAFKWSEIEKGAKTAIAWLYYDYNSMEYDGSKGNYKHGNEYSSYGDVREYLDEILNKNGWTYKSRKTAHPFLRKKTRAYWDITLTRLFNRRFIEVEIRRELMALSRIYGVRFIKA